MNVRKYDLCDEGGSSSTLVLPVGLKLTCTTVVSSQSVDTGLDENESELGVLVLSVGVHVFLDGNSLLDKHVEILRDRGGKAVLLENAEDLVAGDGLDLGDAVGITEHHTDLRWGHTLLRHLSDLVDDAVLVGLQPRRGRPPVRLGRTGDTLAVVVHSSSTEQRSNGVV